MEDSGALPLEMNVDKFNMGDEVVIYPYEQIVADDHDNIITTFNIKSETIYDSVRAGGRINLIIGKSLTNKAQNYLSSNKSISFSKNTFYETIPFKNENKNQGYTLAQKIVGKACNTTGILPGNYCQPIVTSVGSQDTTGPMTRDELKDLACLGFSADLVMQSFCHVQNQLIFLLIILYLNLLMLVALV